MESIRQQKVGRLLQKEIGDLFNQGIVSIGTGMMISVTLVRMSPDLGIAKIYLSIFPSKENSEGIDKVKSAGSEIRYQLGKKVGKQLRHIPELHFYLDDSFDYAEKINDLLK